MKMEPFKRPCSLRWQCWPSCLSIHPKREPICTLLSKDFLRIVFTRCSPKKNQDGFQFEECQFFSRSLEDTTPPFSEVCLVLSMFTLHLPSRKTQPKGKGVDGRFFHQMYQGFESLLRPLPSLVSSRSQWVRRMVVMV